MTPRPPDTAAATGASPTPGGSAALPLPPGDASALLAAARGLRAAAGRAGATASLRGSLRASLPTVWSGAAATAALAEAGTLVSRSRVVLDGLVDSAAVVERYARSIEVAQARVRALQRRWDDAVHERDRGLAMVTTRAGVDPAAAVSHAADRARVLDRHEIAKAVLSREHACVVDELAAQERSAARSLAAVDASVLPPAVSPSRSAVEASLTAGMPVASGAVHARSVRALAVTDAVAVTDLRERVSRGEDVTTDARALAALLRARGGDPVYAQAFVEAVGVTGLQQLLAELVGSGGGASGGAGGGGLDLDAEVAGAVGALLLTAVVPASTGGGVQGLDARTARAVDSRAALLRDRLVAEMGAVHTDAGGGRHSGYWLFAQLLGRARSAGWHRPLPGGLVARLAAATASAERAESRDDDLELVRGTTLSPGGGARFASLQDDPDRSGDALHVLLAEVDDPDSAALVLTTPVDAQGLTGTLTDARGGVPTLADVLARRWVTDRNQTAPSGEPATATPLATDADLLRLTALLPAGGQAAAQVRARVMAELGRTAEFAALSPDTAARQRAEAAELEATVAGWLSQMRASLDRSLTEPAGAGAGGWTASTAAGVQPSLTVAEAASVIGALALDDPWGPGAQEPGPAFVRLVDGELAHLVEVAHAASGETSLQAPEELARTLSRLGFVDQAGSAALVAAARRRDELNRTSWQTLAEAKNVAASLGNPVAAAMTVKDLVTGGTTRSSLDDLVVELVRSDAELEQTRLAEARRATLLDRVQEVVSGGLVGQPGSAAVLLASGASRAPATATSAAVEQTRQRLRTDAATTVLWDRLDDRRSETVRGAVRSTPDAGSAGVVERGARDHRQQKELDTADRLDRAGHDVEFLPASGDGRSADALVDGVLTEFKSPTGGGRSTIIGVLRDGRRQSANVVLDLGGCPLSREEVLRQIDYVHHRYGGLESVVLLHRDGDLERWTP